MPNLHHLSLKKLSQFDLNDQMVESNFSFESCNKNESKINTRKGGSEVSYYQYL